MYYYQPAADGNEILGMTRAVICSGAYGGNNLKMLELFHNYPQGIANKYLGNHGKKQANKRFAREGIVVERLVENTGNWATGKQADLRLSARYSAEFAEALFNLAVDAWKRYNGIKHPDSGIKDW